MKTIRLSDLHKLIEIASDLAKIRARLKADGIYTAADFLKVAERTTLQGIQASRQDAEFEAGLIAQAA